MGVFDSAYVTNFTCPKCDTNYAKIEIQFKAYVGRRYSPNCKSVCLGERLPDFPPIAVFDSQGFMNCDACDWYCYPWVRLEHGVFTGYVHPDEDDDFSPATFPQPKSQRKRERRAVIERTEREKRSNDFEFRLAQQYGSNASAMQRMGFAMAEALVPSLTYEGWARRIFKVSPIPDRVLGNYEMIDGQWKRRRR